MTYLSIPLLMAAVSVSLREAKGTLAPTWSYCECRWELWRAWSNCTSDCFGRRVRTRSVVLKQQAGCAEFKDCATTDEGNEWQGCNEICHNSGDPTGLAWSPCTCQAGYYSNCCTERVNCGNLDSIQNGAVSVTSAYYGGTATYTCNTHYNLTGGNAYRTCNNNFAWSGSEPRCIFVNHCGSTPCRNGATCIDLLDDFRCYCARGWSGRHCENDIQPPVMEDCSRDIRINATDNTVNVSWVPPKFTDPFGSKLDIVSNYPTSAFSFPWGDHTVQYVATKPNNGLVTECTFTIKVRPTPCDELNIPLNGARLCNGWQTDFGRFCFVTCQQNYMLSPAYSFNSWHVCGASGSWRTAGPIPDCDVVVESIAEAENYHPEYANYTYTSSCDNISTKSYLQSLYIEQLKKSGFTMFCTRFSSECEPQNVEVHCSS